jgi:hypothetical protein
MTSLLITHIIIALSGLVMTGIAALHPSLLKIRGSLALTGLTILSGTVLVVKSHAGLTGACVSGLTYVAINLAGLAVAKRRLASVNVTER